MDDFGVYRSHEYAIKKHEIDPKFDDNHEYVVLLCVKRILTEILTEMRKPEVEKKCKYRKFNKLSG